jgi:indolepyruvate ferredoxin oxidoreductase beta subunit
MEVNFLVVGVGGQGTILAGDILAEVGMNGGFDAKKSDILGLAIRSGSVVSHIRWGREVHSPMSMLGQVDYLLAFEPLESLRMAEYLKADSTVIVNDYPIPPVSVTTGEMSYPSREQIDGLLKVARRRYYSINFTEKATQLGNVKVVNIMLLIPAVVWEQTIEKYVPSKLLDVNRRAFQAGRQLTTVRGV